MSQKNAIETKDFILNWIDETSDVQFTIEGLNMLNALEWTIGLWSELGYCYKGAELAERIRERSILLRDNFNDKPDLDWLNFATLGMIIVTADRVKILFHDMQHGKPTSL